MNKEEKNNYIKIEIRENLKKYLNELGFLRLTSDDIITLIFSDTYGGKSIRSIFTIDNLEKSLKELTKTIKLSVPNLTQSDLILIEQGILDIIDLDEDSEDFNDIEDQVDDEKIKARPDVSFEEWLDKLAEKYGFLEYTINKHFPEIWQTIEFILSVKNILHIKNNTLPFAGIILGPASSSKTLGIEMLRKIEMTFYTDSFTPKSFVSHNRSVKQETLEKIDMLPKIKNKLFLTPELTPLFSSKDDDLLIVLAIITRILDGHGYESDSGSTGHRGYNENIMFTWIGAAIEVPRKVYKHLGTLGPKLYFFRMTTKNKTNQEYIHDLKYNDYLTAKTEVESALIDYLKWFDYCPIGEVQSDVMKIECDFTKDDEKILEYIVKLAKLLSHLRAVTQTWETRGTQGSDYAYSIPIIEHPSRAMTSLRNLSHGHALLHGRTNISIEDISIIIKTVLSTAPIERTRIFDLLLKNEGKLTSSQIIEHSTISRPTASKTMTELEILGLVDLEKESDAENALITITLRDEFDWFLSQEFQELRDGFIPEEFECKEKMGMSETETSFFENETSELKECKEKIPTSEPENFVEKSQNELSIFWKVYNKLEESSEEKNDKGISMVNHDALVYFLTNDTCNYYIILTKESIEEIIIKLVEEGFLIVENSNFYTKGDVI